MTAIQYSIVSSADGPYITVFGAADTPLVAGPEHPNHEAILDALVEGETDPTYLNELLDVSAAIASRFDHLSDRVTVSDGRVYLDGDEAHGAITNHIVRFLEAGVDDWRPLVAFFENVQANPNDHSRQQLYDWLDAHDFTITPQGYIVGYKGVDSELRSIHSGGAIVDGQAVQGKVPNQVGSTVEMPRSEVAHDPATACSTGLHVGTRSYANSWARGALLEVHVNPRDVVSVPTDAAGEKVRVCRYTVANAEGAPYSAPLSTWESRDEEDLYDDDDDEY